MTAIVKPEFLKWRKSLANHNMRRRDVWKAGWASAIRAVAAEVAGQSVIADERAARDCTIHAEARAQAISEMIAMLDSPTLEWPPGPMAEATNP